MAVQWGIAHEKNAKGSPPGAEKTVRLHPSGMSGGSPDGLTGDEGTLQVKSYYSMAEHSYKLAKYKDAYASQAGRFVIFALVNLISG